MVAFNVRLKKNGSTGTLSIVSREKNTHRRNKKHRTSGYIVLGLVLSESQIKIYVVGSVFSFQLRFIYIMVLMVETGL